MSTRTCPKCHLIAPISADRCDCGYLYEDLRALAESGPTSHRPEERRPRASTIGGRAEVFRTEGNARVKAIENLVFAGALGGPIAGLGYTFLEMNEKAKAGLAFFEYDPVRYVKSFLLILGGLALISVAVWNFFAALFYNVEVGPESISVNRDILRWDEITRVELCEKHLLIEGRGIQLKVRTTTDGFDYIVRLARETVAKPSEDEMDRLEREVGDT